MFGAYFLQSTGIRARILGFLQNTGIRASIMEGCRAEVERGDEREEKQVESLQAAYTQEPEKL